MEEVKKVLEEERKEYEQTAQIIDAFAASVSGEEEEEDEKIGQKILLFFKENWYDILIGFCYLGLLVYSSFALLSFFKAVYLLDLGQMKLSTWKFVIVTLFCTVLWISSTASTFYNFYSMKFSGLYLCVATVAILITSAIYSLMYSMFIPYIARLKPTELMSEQKIAGLGWIVTVVPTFILVILLLIRVVKGIQSDDNQEAIQNFKIKHHLPQWYSPYEYVMDMVQDLSSGVRQIIRAKDRFLHSNIVGATGTAKTSSIIIPSVNKDLQTKINNEDAQKKVLQKLIKKGKVEIVKPFRDEDFSAAIINHGYVRPMPGYEKLYKKKVLKYQSAGITVIGPDPSLADEVYELTTLYKVPCNRIDPNRNDDGTIKEGSKGLNPLYISPLTQEWAIRKEMVKRATLVADVMQAMFEMGGKSDPYFSSVNRIATTTACMVVMMVHKRVFPNETPTLKHVQNIINDFSLLSTLYLKELIAYNKEHNNVYKPIIDVVNKQFLNNGSTNPNKFDEHCTGLRIQLNNFLMHPDIERLLCCEDSIDLDLLLQDGQVTVANFELGDLGTVNSTCFGLFFVLSLVNAVLRRKGNERTRLPHFIDIDEMPLILCPQMEPCYTLFRKFKAAMMGAVQTMDQFEKTPFLKYMKGVVLSNCSHHFVYGRSTLGDQEIFSKLSGVKNKVTYKEGYSSNALSSDNPSLTIKGQYEVEEIARVSESKIREKDFQEMTFFTVRDGRPLDAIHGKTNFLKEKDKKPRKRYRVNWEELYKEQCEKREALAAEAAAASSMESNVTDSVKAPVVPAAGQAEYTQVTVHVSAPSVPSITGEEQFVATTAILNATAEIAADTEDIVKEEEFNPLPEEKGTEEGTVEQPQAEAITKEEKVTKLELPPEEPAPIKSLEDAPVKIEEDDFAMSFFNLDKEE